MRLNNKSRGPCLYRFLLEFSLLLIFFVAGCSQDENSRTIETLNIAVLPEQNKSRIINEYQPLLGYLKSYTGLNTKLLIPNSYSELLQWFDNKKVDLALFGGVTFVKASLNSNAIPLVMRDVDNRFNSVALVRADNPANSLQDLKGASLVFGSRFSTSGHLMPRYFFQQQNIIPEAYFSDIQYSEAHDRTAEWIRDGKAEVGIVNAGIINKMFMDGHLNKDRVKIIWTSPAYADYIWAMQPDINKQQRLLVRDAFMSMSHDSENKSLLHSLGANYYIPARLDDFNHLQHIIQQFELSDLTK